MKLNLKKLAVLTSSLLVVACNGGGSSGGYVPPGPQTNYCTQDGVPEYNRTTSYSINEQVQYNNNRYLKISTINDVNPSEYPSVWKLLGSCNEPYTPPEILQPLKFKSIGTPLNLNKVGGNAVWYMLVTNPNNESIAAFSIDKNTNSIFAQRGYQNYDPNIIHPMDYAESYNQEVSGYTNIPDCLSFTDGALIYLNSNQSCIYKFRAFWNANLDMPQSNSYQIDYEFYPYSNGKVNFQTSYCTSDVFKCNYTIPYDSNNTLSYQSTNLSSQDVVESMLGFSNFVFSGDGSTVLTWVQQSLVATQSVSTYSVNYNASTNKLSLSNQQNYSGWTPYNSYDFDFITYGFLSYNGNNFGAAGFNNMVTLGWNQLNVNGTNGTVYTSDAVNNTAFKSTTGDFINSSNYSQLSNAWSAMSYNIMAFDETNNIALLRKRNTKQNFCYNMNTGIYTELYNPASVPQQYNFGGSFELNNASLYTVLPIFNNKIYTNVSGMYGVGQNGQLYLNTNISSVRVIDTVNCSVSSNLDFYTFSILSYAAYINSTITASTPNYSLISKNKVGTTYLVNNSNM